MRIVSLRVLLACIALAISAPVLADRDDHDRHHHKRHRGHDHDRGYDRGYDRDDSCRYKGWYDRYGDYHERRVCRDRQVRMMPGPAVYLPPPQSVVFQPPSLHIQPPGIYVR